MASGRTKKRQLTQGGDSKSLQRVRAGIFIPIFLLVTGCNAQRYKQELTLGIEPTFSAVQTYIIERKCLACHGGPNSPMMVDLSSYDAILNGGLVVPQNPEGSRLYDSVRQQRMPKSGNPLTALELALVADWIRLGALKDGTAEPDPAPVPTFEWIQTYLLQKRCVTCHDGAHPKTRLDLRTYEALLSYEGQFLLAVEKGEPELSLLFTVVQGGIMPPDGPKVPSDAIAAIAAWIKNGAKANAEIEQHQKKL